MLTSSNSTRKGSRAPYTHCKPPKDCFTCKYSDCVAGINKRATKEETQFYAISGNRVYRNRWTKVNCNKIIRSTPKGFEELSGDEAEKSKAAFSEYFGENFVDCDTEE